MANEKRLIYAGDAKKLFDDIPSFIGMTGKCVQGMLDKAPTVDAVEVVRCKDCVHWQEHDGDMYCGCWANLMTDTAADDFCSYGERKCNERKTD